MKKERILKVPRAPKREPDMKTVEKIFPRQALIYRLNGHPSPIHVDPRAV
jgi:hypothetical protein